MQKLSTFRKERVLTCEGDVEAPVSVGVVRQELQPGHVAAGGDGRREDVPGKGAEDGRFGLAQDTKTKRVIKRGEREERRRASNEAAEGCLDSTRRHAFGVMEDNSLPAPAVPFLHP